MWCLKMKADPFVRDKRGKLAMEKTKNDKIKSLLKDGMYGECVLVLALTRAFINSPYPVLAKSSFPVSPTSADSAVTLQGVLHKWTNYAGGYKKRWFVLENGRRVIYEWPLFHFCKTNTSILKASYHTTAISKMCPSAAAAPSRSKVGVSFVMRHKYFTLLHKHTISIIFAIMCKSRQALG